jgi:tripartite-type tricarboxylate transporter receptor subunit TctC
MTTFIKLLFATLIAWSMPLLANPAYPSKPVKIIISLPAGSGPDVQLRRVAEILSEKWKQPVTVENRPGGSGIVARSQVVNDSANGYTIGLFHQGDIVAFPILYGNDKNKTLDNLEILAPFFTADLALFTSPEIKNLSELKQLLKNNPNYGSWGVGSIQHVLGAEFASIYVNNATHIPYRDGNLFTDVNSKLLSFGFASLGSGNAMYQAGKIQWLAVASEQRNKKFPDVPTIREITGHRVVSQSWLAFFIRKDTPSTVKQQLEKDIQSAVTDQRMQSFLADNHFIPLNNVTLTQFVKQVEQEKLNYKNNLKRHNISLN